MYTYSLPLSFFYLSTYIHIHIHIYLLPNTLPPQINIHRLPLYTTKATPPSPRKHNHPLRRIKPNCIPSSNPPPTSITRYVGELRLFCHWSKHRPHYRPFIHHLASLLTLPQHHLFPTWFTSALDHFFFQGLASSPHMIHEWIYGDLTLSQVACYASFFFILLLATSLAPPPFALALVFAVLIYPPLILLLLVSR